MTNSLFEAMADLDTARTNLRWTDHWIKQSETDLANARKQRVKDAMAVGAAEVLVRSLGGKP